VERFGIDRTLNEIKKADIVLLLVDASRQLSTEDEQALLAAGEKRVLVVFNKVDLGIKAAGNFGGERPKFMISALSGEGVAALKKGLVDNTPGGNNLEEISRGVINTRHKECLFRAQDSLEKIMTGLIGGEPLDLIAIDVRGAIIALGEISGEQVSEEVIDQIFQNFCIGK
jgi:tRNA modification GTPase